MLVKWGEDSPRAACPLHFQGYGHLVSEIAAWEQQREIAAWEQQQNASGARIKWMFTTDKARAKMARAYPDPAAPARDAQLKGS